MYIYIDFFFFFLIFVLSFLFNIKMCDKQYYFGQFKIHKSQIFFNSKYSFGLVNLKPISP